MKYFRLCALAALSSVSVVASAQTYLGTLNDRNWYYHDAMTSWHTALSYALGFGGNLASIRSQEENDWLVARGVSEIAWIGLTDEAVEGTFVWMDGAPFTYANWYPGQPNDFGHVENAVVFNFVDPGTWGDTNGDFVGFAEGSIITTPVPEPSALLALGAGAICSGLARSRRRRQAERRSR